MRINLFQNSKYSYIYHEISKDKDVLIIIVTQSWKFNLNVFNDYIIIYTFNIQLR